MKSDGFWKIPFTPFTSANRRTRGSDGVRDEGLCFGSGTTAKSSAYGEEPPDISGLAAALAYGIAKNHPLLTEKRTA